MISVSSHRRVLLGRGGWSVRCWSCGFVFVRWGTLPGDSMRWSDLGMRHA